MDLATYTVVLSTAQVQIRAFDCQLGPYHNTAPNIYGTQKGAIILTTTHILGLYRDCMGLILCI